jgi:hypothetical protein
MHEPTPPDIIDHVERTLRAPASALAVRSCTPYTETLRETLRARPFALDRASARVIIGA